MTTIAELLFGGPLSYPRRRQVIVFSCCCLRAPHNTFRCSGLTTMEL